MGEGGNAKSAQLRQQEIANSLDEAASFPYDWREFLAVWEAEIYEHAQLLAAKIVANGTRQYLWLADSREDLQQELLVRLPHFAERYDPTKGASWSKNLYHRFAFYLKDVLRKEDPVGISFPQRERYPTWHRLGSHVVAESDSTEYHWCGSDIDASNLLAAAEVDEDELLCQSGFTALATMAADNRKVNCLPSMVDAGTGVCRSTSKDSTWDRLRNRVKFRGNSLRAWCRNRYRKPRKKTGKRMSEPTAPIDAKTCIEAVQFELEKTLSIGATVAELHAVLQEFKEQTLGSAIRRLLAAGKVYLIGSRPNAVGKVVDVFALAKHFPGGPPIPQPTVKTKPTIKKKLVKKSVAAKPRPKPESADIMLVVTALAGVRHAELKSRLLAVLTEAMQA